MTATNSPVSRAILALAWAMRMELRVGLVFALLELAYAFAARALVDMLVMPAPMVAGIAFGSMVAALLLEGARHLVVQGYPPAPPTRAVEDLPAYQNAALRTLVRRRLWLVLSEPRSRDAPTRIPCAAPSVRQRDSERMASGCGERRREHGKAARALVASQGDRGAALSPSYATSISCSGTPSDTPRARCSSDCTGGTSHGAMAYP
jgi:hypothetical protein